MSPFGGLPDTTVQIIDRMKKLAFISAILFIIIWCVTGGIARYKNSVFYEKNIFVTKNGVLIDLSQRFQASIETTLVKSEIPFLYASLRRSKPFKLILLYEEIAPKTAFEFISVTGVTLKVNGNNYNSSEINGRLLREPVKKRIKYHSLSGKRIEEISMSAMITIDIPINVNFKNQDTIEFIMEIVCEKLKFTESFKLLYNVVYNETSGFTTFWTYLKRSA